MMVMHGCLIFCFLAGFPRGFIAYLALSGNEIFENYDQKNFSFDEYELRKLELSAESFQNVEHKVHFGYRDDDTSVYGPRNWGRINSNCDGKAQSPVNLEQKLMRRLFASPPLVIGGFNKVPSTVMMANNGHSAMAKLMFSDKSQVTVSGGPLVGSYVLDNIHWHWGRRDDAGSEHAIDGARSAAEMHLVLHSSKFSSANEAVSHPGGLAVLAFIYDLSNKLGATYNPFVPLLSKVIQPDTTYSETRNLFTIRDLIKSTGFHYVTYQGSLTSPMCYEGVTWIVSTNKLFISSKELQEFRKIKDEHGNQLLENDRPLQKLNGRALLSH